RGHANRDHRKFLKPPNPHKSTRGTNQHPKSKHPRKTIHGETANRPLNRTRRISECRQPTGKKSQINKKVEYADDPWLSDHTPHLFYHHGLLIKLPEIEIFLTHFLACTYREIE